MTFPAGKHGLAIAAILAGVPEAVLAADAAPAPEPVAAPSGAGLFDSDRVRLRLGGEARWRAEAIDTPSFGLSGASDTYLLHRYLLHVDAQMGDAVRVFAEGGDHETTGKKRNSPTDRDSLEVQQLFVELAPKSGLALRLGRQELSFNPTQRFVSVRDTANVRQSFDGAKVTFSTGRLRLDGFAVRPLTLRAGAFDNSGNDDVRFAGLYASYRTDDSKGAPTIDGYVFDLKRQNLTIGSRKGVENRRSIGIRFAGTRNAFDWDAEAMMQLGSFAGQRIRAGGVFIDLGRSFPQLPLAPRLGVRFDWGSGDGHPADQTLGTFHPLFPKSGYFNEAGVTSFANLIAVRISARARMTPKLTGEIAAQAKLRARVADAVYLHPASSLPATLGNDAREIGQTYNVDLTYKASSVLSLRGYLLHHTAGDAVRTAGGRAVTYAMACACFKF